MLFISDLKTKTPVLGVLPPPPIPPPGDDYDGCVSPSGADNLSNADSGVADVAGDGLNLSHGHRHTHGMLNTHFFVFHLDIDVPYLTEAIFKL